MADSEEDQRAGEATPPGGKSLITSKTLLRQFDNLMAWVKDSNSEPSEPLPSPPIELRASSMDLPEPSNNRINKRSPADPISDQEPTLEKLEVERRIHWLAESTPKNSIRRAPGSRHGSTISDEIEEEIFQKPKLVDVPSDIDSEQFNMQRNVNTEIEFTKAIISLKRLKKELKKTGRDDTGPLAVMVDECMKSVKEVKKKVLNMTREMGSHGQVQQYRNLLHHLGHNEQFQEEEREVVQWISQTHMAPSMTPSASLGSHRRMSYMGNSRRASMLSRASAISGVSEGSQTPSSSMTKLDTPDVPSKRPSQIAIQVTSATPLPSSLSSPRFDDDDGAEINLEERKALYENVKIREVMDQVAQCLANFQAWDFDVFNLHTVAGDMTLPICGLQMFREMHVEDRFGIGEEAFVDFMNRVSMNYQPLDKVLYHNFIHGADVMCTHYYFMRSDPFAIVSDLDRFASICAAAAHDIGHNGFANNFHARTESKLAILYNDKSILENHHASLGWTIIRQTKLLENLSPAQREQFRSVFLHCILSTDMTLHSSHLEELITIAECRSNSAGERSPLETSERLLGLSVHSADISNVAKPFELCTKSVDRVFEEFFRQGDREAELGLSYSMLCDREKTNIPKSEALFIQLLVKPWYSHWVSLIQKPGKICMKTLESNYNRYVHSSQLMEPPKMKIRKRKSMFERGAFLKIQLEAGRTASDTDFRDRDNIKTPDADDLNEFANKVSVFGNAPHIRVHSGEELGESDYEDDNVSTGAKSPVVLTPNATPEEYDAMRAELPPKKRLDLANTPSHSTARIPLKMLENSDDEGDAKTSEDSRLPLPISAVADPATPPSSGEKRFVTR